MLMTIRLADILQFEGENAVIMMKVQTKGNIIPIRDTIEGKEVKIIVKGEVSIEMSYTEVIVQVCRDQAVAVESGHVF